MAKPKSQQSLFRLEARQEALKILHRLAAEGKIKIEALTLLEMALENKHSLANLTPLSPPPTASPTNPTFTTARPTKDLTSVFDDIYINGSVSSNISNTSCGISISEGDVLQVEVGTPETKHSSKRYGKEELLNSSTNFLLASHRECTKCGLKKPRQHFRKRQLAPKNRFTIRCVSCSKQMHYNKQQLQQRRQQQHYTQQQQQQNTTTPGRPPPNYSYSHAQLGPPHHHFHHYHRPTATTAATTTTNYAQQYVPNSVSSSVFSSMNSNSYNTTNTNTNTNNNTINTNTNHNPYLQQELPPPPPRCLTMIDHEDDDDASTMFEDDSSMWQELENMTMTRLRIAEKTTEAAMTKATPTTAATTPTTVTVPSVIATATTAHSEEGGDGNGNEDTLLLVGSALDFDWFELLGQHDEEVSSFEFKLEGTSTSPRSTIQNSDDLLDASTLWRNNNPWLQKQQQQQTI